MEEDSYPLHACNTSTFKHFTIVNRCHGLIHSIALAFLLYYRFSFLLQGSQTGDNTPITPWLLIFSAELFLSFQWILGQAYRWRPVSRTVFPERLPPDDKLPAVDVFIFTADPMKEPTLEVMNTVISAMALDYPAEKLHLYLSDDGGAAITLYGLREASMFARHWVPFCKRFGIKTICPKVYFSTTTGNQEYYSDHSWNAAAFTSEREKIKEMYFNFKERLEKAAEDGLTEDVSAGNSRRDHPAVIEVIQEKCDVDVHVKLPSLVYVSREKRPSHPISLKAGAINVLLRVSGVLSNSPYILILDCDMYCNDPSSARQAMCFHLHPKISPTLAFVQFPQMFDNVVNDNDIYGSSMRHIFKFISHGVDGLQGPLLAGTNFYLKRKALYGKYIQGDLNMKDPEKSIGKSNEFIKSLRLDQKPIKLEDEDTPRTLLRDIKVLASCTYEDHTEWGKTVGYLYSSILDDLCTGYKALHCEGWRSVYLSPSRPQFLGTATINFNELMIQGTRWSCGLVQVALSRFSPLIYGPSKLSLLQRISFIGFVFNPLIDSFALYCFATIPQLCLFYAIPLFPKVSDLFSFIFLFIFIFSLLRHLFEVIYTSNSGAPVRMLINEQRIWMIKSVTLHLYGSLIAILETIGVRKTNFLATNKIKDDDQAKRYEMGIFDFQTSTMFLAPLSTIIFLNMASLCMGLTSMVLTNGGFDKLLMQVLLSFYILVMNYPIIEGMFLRKDKARIRQSVTLLSAVISIIFLSLGYIILI